MRCPALALAPVTVAVAALTFTSCVPATNPFDPDTPAALQQPARVSGVVVDDAGDVPVKAALVTLTDPLAADGRRSVETGDDGAFAFDTVTPGVTTLSVTQAAHAAFARDLLLLPGDERNETVVLTKLVDGARVHGIARKGTEVDEGDAADHSGIIVEIAGIGARTVTNASGDYDFVVADGTYSLVYSAAEHIAQTVPDVVDSGAAGGTVIELETVTLAANPGSVSGVVTLEPLVPGTEEHGGVTVTVAGNSAVTGADDSYTITGLAGGAAVVRYTRDAYETAERVVVVEAGVLTALDPVRLARATGGLVGAVDVAGGGDDGGATVTLAGTPGTFATVSASDGSFTFSTVPSGTYNLRASLAGFVPADGGAVVIEPAQTTTVPDALVLTALVGDFAIDGGAQFTRDLVVDLLIVGADDAVQMRLSESATFADVPAPVAFDPAPQFTLAAAPGDGPRTIFLELIDGNGDASGPFSASITLDTQAPGNASIDVTGAVGGAFFTNDANGIVPLALFADDAGGSGVASMQIAVNGAFDEASAPFVDFATTLAFPVPTNLDGSYTLSARFRDRAGNEAAATLPPDPSAPPSLTVTLDRAAPAVGSVVVRDASTGRTDFATSSFVVLDITRAAGSDDAELMALSTDALFPVETFEPFAAQRAFTLVPGEGARTAAVKLRDRAGNESNALSASIVVDTTPPAGAFVQLAGGADVVNTDTVSLTLVADDFAEARLSLDGVFDASPAEDYVALALLPTSIALGVGGDGVGTVFAQFRDAAGNESDVVSDSVSVDVTGPVVDADTGIIGDAIVIASNGTDAEGAPFTSSVSVDVSFDVAGADEMALAVDADGVSDEPFEPFSSLATVLLPPGDCPVSDDACKRVCAVFRDRAGNVSAEVCDDIGLDTQAPAAPLFVEDDFVSAASALTLHLVDKVEDDFFSHYRVLISPTPGVFADLAVGAPVAGALPFDVALTAPATGTPSADAAETNLVRIVAVDLAGNVSAESVLTVVVDDVAPAAPQLAPLAPVVNADTVSLSFVASNPADDDATFDHYRIATTALGGGSVDSFQRDGIVLALVADSNNDIDVVAVDAAGNESAPVTVAIREDSTRPTAPVINPLAAVVRARQVELVVIVPSTDQFDVDGDGDVDAQDTPQALARYELKDGQGLGFQPALPLGTGPFTAVLRTDRENELCLRGLDAAGNESDAECIVVNEASSTTVVGVNDEPRAHDIAGDFVVYTGDNSRLFLRDMRGALADTELATGLTGPPLPGDESDIAMVSDTSFVRIAYDSTLNGGSVALHIVDVAGASFLTPAAFTGFASSIGTATPGTTIAEVVYAVAGAQPGTVDLRRRPAVLPLGAPEVDITPADIVLCDGTTPVVHNGVVVWCETVSGGLNVVKRQRVPGGAIDTISRPGASVPLERRGFFAFNPPRVMQPVVTAQLIAWAEDAGAGGGGVARLVYLDDPVNDVQANAQQIDVVDGVNLDVDLISDASGPLIGLLQVAANGIADDVFVLDPIARTLTAITNDLPPNNDISVDFGRVSFKDVSRGDAVVVVDRTQLRWVSASNELSFDPMTSTSAMAWVETRGAAIRLLARRVPIDNTAIVEVDEPPALPVAFAGPTREDPRWAVGGTVVAWLSASASPGPFQLTAKEIVSGAAASVAADVLGPIAMDPDGDAVVYVDSANRVQRVALTFSAGPPASLTAGAPALISAVAGGVRVAFVDVDDGMSVWQEGGDENNDTAAGTLKCRSGAGAVNTIDLGGSGLPNLGRGPKLGKRGAFDLLAYLESGTLARGCLLNCVPGPNNCFPRIALSAAGTNGTKDAKIGVGRDGIVAYLNDELGGAPELVVVDPFSGRRAWYTLDDFEQIGLSVADGRAVWTDPSLGTFDIWELKY